MGATSSRMMCIYHIMRSLVDEVEGWKINQLAPSIYPIGGFEGRFQEMYSHLFYFTDK